MPTDPIEIMPSAVKLPISDNSTPNYSLQSSILETPDHQLEQTLHDYDRENKPNSTNNILFLVLISGFILGIFSIANGSFGRKLDTIACYVIYLFPLPDFNLHNTNDISTNDEAPHNPTDNIRQSIGPSKYQGIDIDGLMRLIEKRLNFSLANDSNNLEDAIDMTLSFSEQILELVQSIEVGRQPSSERHELELEAKKLIQHCHSLKIKDVENHRFFASYILNMCRDLHDRTIKSVGKL